MAISRNNIVTETLSGKIGDIIFKNKGNIAYDAAIFEYLKEHKV